MMILVDMQSLTMEDWGVQVVTVPFILLADDLACMSSLLCSTRIWGKQHH